MADWIDAGHGISYKFARCDKSPERCMVIVRQTRPDGTQIIGRANLAVPCRAGLREPWWQVESLDPLTISPSIHCEQPNVGEFHGFIRNGRWEPA